MEHYELSAYRVLFQMHKRELCDTAVDMYCKGYYICTIVNRLYPKFFKLDNQYTKSEVFAVVQASIYDYLMNEKLQGK